MPLPNAIAELPWSHNTTLIEKLDAPDLRLWYAERTRRFGWSRPVLGMQIETSAHTRQGRALTNFADHLPAKDSDLARQLLKDPYLFGFLGLEDEAQERDIEAALIAHVREFLLELGVGFAFVGSQYHLEIGDQDFYLDLLFYHLKLHRYVVVELKARSFEPAHTGQLSFYMAAVDDLVRDPERDEPTIGLLLCKSRNQVIVEYALRNAAAPIGVSEYRLTDSLPDELRGRLPTVAELERELGDEVDNE